MKQIAVVYWSGTGNTEAMAQEVAAGAGAAGCRAQVFTAAEFSADMMEGFDAVAFGCPSMGSEQLEEDEFEPMYSSCRPKLDKKRVGLFGSYGWGDGEWMREWQEACRGDGAELAMEGVICNETPDEEARAACQQLGMELAR